MKCSFYSYKNTNGQSVEFNRIIERASKPNYIIGQSGPTALLAQVSFDGQATKIKQFAVVVPGPIDAPLKSFTTFHSGVEADRNKVLILGTVTISDRLHLFVTKVKANGEMDWSKSIYSKSTKGESIDPGGIISYNGNFLISFTEFNKLFLIEIDKDGRVVRKTQHAISISLLQKEVQKEVQKVEQIKKPQSRLSSNLKKRVEFRKTISNVRSIRVEGVKVPVVLENKLELKADFQVVDKLVTEAGELIICGILDDKGAAILLFDSSLNWKHGIGLEDRTSCWSLCSVPENGHLLSYSSAKGSGFLRFDIKDEKIELVEYLLCENEFAAFARLQKRNEKYSAISFKWNKPYGLLELSGLNARTAKVYDIVPKEGSAYLQDVSFKEENFYVVGSDRGENSSEGIYIRSDHLSNICNTHTRQLRIESRPPPNTKKLLRKNASITLEQEVVPLRSADFTVTSSNKCPEKRFPEISNRHRSQSKNLYLSVTGSTGQIASKGILLRGHLRNDLENHLPKGDYSETAHHFNKPDDYINVYRLPYSRIGRSIDLITVPPISKDDASAVWVYEAFHPESDKNRIPIKVKFLNKTKYDSVIQSLSNPHDNSAFYSAYTGMVEVSLPNHLAFATELKFTPLGAGFQARIETFSTEYFGSTELSVSSRSKVHDLSISKRIVTENIQSVKTLVLNGRLAKVNFEVYHDQLRNAVGSQTGIHVTDFALNTNTGLAFNRLEDPVKYRVHNAWKKFSGNNKVNVENYKTRWLQEDGLKSGIETYLSLSESDYRALVEYQNPDEPEEKIKISALDGISIASLDYLNAIEMGLGFIDTVENDSEEFIYFAFYITKSNANSTAANALEIYMSPPVSVNFERLPLDIKALTPKYGLTVPDGTDSGYLITDSEGYTEDGMSRYVQLFAILNQDPEEYHYFYNPSLPFNLFENTHPVFVGIKNRLEGEITWREPNITVSDVYKDTSSPKLPEVLPIPFSDTEGKPIFIDQHRENGTWEYLFYGINIFSMAGGESYTKCDDVTLLKPANRLLPPSNIQAHFIQEESPPMFTTQVEQARLSGITNIDRSLLRLTFDYNHIHDKNHGFGDNILVHWHNKDPRHIQGKVTFIQDIDEATFKISTGSYLIVSNGQTLDPTIDPIERDKFKGGIITIKEHQFEIHDVNVVTGNPYPEFILGKLKEHTTQDLGGGNLITITNKTIPDGLENSMFLAVQHMGLEKNWDYGPLVFKIAIDSSQWTLRNEEYIDHNGEIQSVAIRGLNDSIIIQTDVEPGNYRVLFSATQLNSHVQHSTDPNSNSVQWYKGTLRIKRSDSYDWEEFNVLRILNMNTGSNLELLIYDQKHEKRSLANQTFEANYYPGYKVYLIVDNGADFNEVNLFPDNGFVKTNYIGLQTVDNDLTTQTGDPYKSPIGLKEFKVTKIELPKRPMIPGAISMYAAPTNKFNQASFSLLPEFESKPYGFIIYKADNQNVLSQLYKRETLIIVKETLKHDSFYTDRFQEIINIYNNLIVNNPGIDVEFSQFPEDTGFALPKPDADLFDKGDIIENYIKAIEGAFSPVTEMPILMEYVNDSPSHIPLNNKQMIRDEAGRLLKPDDPRFEMAPMAKKLSDSKVLFVDFDLDGGSFNKYFYYVRECNVQMLLGEPSGILGPVHTVDVLPDQPPVIRKVYSQNYDKNTFIYEPKICFDVIVPKTTQVTELHVHRAYNSLDAKSILSMSKVKSFNIRPDMQGQVITFFDDFENDDYYPFAEELYYRLSYSRDVEYYDSTESNLISKKVPSISSSPILSNLIDQETPSPPKLNVTYDRSANALQNIHLTWDKVVHNASYKLLQLNEHGNWLEVTDIKSNDPADLNFILPSDLPGEDEFGDKIYHRFKIEVTNSSLMINKRDRIVTIPFEE